MDKKGQVTTTTEEEEEKKEKKELQKKKKNDMQQFMNQDGQQFQQLNKQEWRNQQQLNIQNIGNEMLQANAKQGLLDSIQNLTDDQIAKFIKQNSGFKGLDSKFSRESVLRPFFDSFTDQNGNPIAQFGEAIEYTKKVQEIQVHALDSYDQTEQMAKGINENSLQVFIPSFVKCKISNSTENSRMKKQNVKNVYIYAERFFNYGTILYDMILNKPKQEVLDFFGDDKNEITMKDWEKFVQTYGWFIPLSVTYGGKLYETKQKVIVEDGTQESQINKFKIEAKADLTSVGLQNVGVGVGKNNQQSNSREEGKQMCEQTNMICRIGGDHSTDVNEWASSLGQDQNYWGAIKYSSVKPTYEYLKPCHQKKIIKLLQLKEEEEKKKQNLDSDQIKAKKRSEEIKQLAAEGNHPCKLCNKCNDYTSEVYNTVNEGFGIGGRVITSILTFGTAEIGYAAAAASGKCICGHQKSKDHL